MIGGGVTFTYGQTNTLIGRDGDLRRVRDLLGFKVGGGSLLLAGDAGVGKTAVLDALARTADEEGIRVLRAAGVEFEADCSYSCLNQILFPFLDTLDDLEVPFREALRVALGFDSGRPPERLLVSNAVLRLLQKVAAAGPLLVVIDDLPWVDRASTAVLGFVARRVTGLGVSFLAAARSGARNLVYEGGGLPTYELPPLDEESATQLVGIKFPGLARSLRQHLLAVADGNPLALLELPTALQPTSADPPTVLPLSRRLETLFGSRVTGLPTPSRRLLLLAALEGTGDLGVLQAASRQANDGYDLADLAPAEHDQLVRIEGSTRRLRFRHPLIRSAVVGNSTSGEQRAVHGALAQVLVDQPERRAWHLGEATVEPDEEVAALLEDAARLTLHRGDAAGGMRTLIRSAHLTPQGQNRSRRLAEAAYLGAEATGALPSARKLLDDARHAAPNPVNSLHSATATALLVLNSDGDVDTAHRLLVAAIESTAETHGYDAGDKALVDALHMLALICFFGARAELWQPYYRALERLKPKPPLFLSTLGRTFSDPARTGAVASGELDLLIASLPGETDPMQITRIGTAALYLDRLGEVREAAWRMVRTGRDGGPARRHLSALIHLCLDDYLSGRWDEALDLADEGLQICEEHGYTAFAWYYLYIKSIISGARGNADDSLATASRIIDWASARGAHCAGHYAHHAAAVASLGRGDFPGAYEHAAAVSPAGSLASHAPHALWVATDLVEAGVRINRDQEAADHVRAMREAHTAALSPRHALLLDGAAALCTTDDEEALRLFERALATPGAERWRFEYARIQLAHGERLRRIRATAESRKPLGAALVTFEHLGARPWVERAEQELRAAGWNRRSPGEPKGRTLLTPQEREIARLAASGLTNKQIAERLFLSHRTVGAHLYQIYPKLGITSRAMLRDALDSRATSRRTGAADDGPDA
ncbi:ATP-binding protein [Streptomyces sp. NPDC058423]|uniref:ATP-binding protein n=1 Tax=unclassified Streptomyces TaxID=2593676 RepID=UPI00365A42DA